MEEEEIVTDEFNDWLHLRTSTNLSSTLQSSHSNPHGLTAIRTTRSAGDDFSIFPPINHEGLPITSSLSSPPLSLPPSSQVETSVYQVDDAAAAIPSSKSSSSSPPSPASHVARWFNLALQILNSKIVAAFPCGHLKDSFCSIGSTVTGSVTTATFFVVLCMWVLRWRRRQRLCVEGARIKHLMLVIKEKDEKIIELLSHIAEMNKLLLCRYKNSVLRASYPQIQQ